MMFCPRCGSLLYMGLLTNNDERFMASQCYKCPYMFRLRKPYIVDSPVNPKTVEAIISEEERWKNVEATNEKCPKCEHPRAFFLQIQTRSADEPMTIFYRCCDHECSHTWRE